MLKRILVLGICILLIAVSAQAYAPYPMDEIAQELGWKEETGIIYVDDSSFTWDSTYSGNPDTFTKLNDASLDDVTLSIDISNIEIEQLDVLGKEIQFIKLLSYLILFLLIICFIAIISSSFSRKEW
ncbi:MAG: hypothetical protein ABIA66_00890 [Candidatus Omnitrophota bacterium]